MHCDSPNQSPSNSICRNWRNRPFSPSWATDSQSLTVKFAFGRKTYARQRRDKLLLEVLCGSTAIRHAVMSALYAFETCQWDWDDPVAIADKDCESARTWSSDSLARESRGAQTRLTQPVFDCFALRLTRPIVSFPGPVC